MAIWEQPEMLSGQKVTQGAAAGVKPVVGIAILCQEYVTIEWAFNLFHLFINIKQPFVYLYCRNKPYGVCRTEITKELLKRGCDWIYSLDTDVLPPPDVIPRMIQLSQQYDKPVLTGLYWAKKREPQPMPAAWIKTGENKEENRIFYQNFDVKPYLDKNALLQISVCGAGCLLVHRSIFEKLDKSNPNLAYFEWGSGRKDHSGKPLKQLSEDFYFCDRVSEELQIFPHLATDIKCDHICVSRKRASDGQLEVM